MGESATQVFTMVQTRSRTLGKGFASTRGDLEHGRKNMVK